MRLAAAGRLQLLVRLMNDSELTKKERKRIYDKEYRLKNADRIRQIRKNYAEQHSVETVLRVKKWRENNPEKTKENALRQRQKKPEKIKIAVRNSVKKSRDELRDNYVRTALRLNKSQATPELICLKRDQLSIARLLKELNEELKMVEL